MIESSLDSVPFSERMAWVRRFLPLTRAVLARHVAPSGARVLLCTHFEPKMVPLVESLLDRGTTVTIAPCLPGVLHADTFAYLHQHGARTLGAEATDGAALRAAWARALDPAPGVVLDTGGGVIAIAAEAQLPLRAACEVTRSGVARLASVPLPWPVFNLDDAPLKTLLHNRYEVGNAIWYGFRRLTDLDVCRTTVGIIGYGHVGQSIAAAAHGLGARVLVHDRRPDRELVAASDGWATMELAALLRHAEVVVTATGARAVLDAATMAQHARGDAIFCNAGHSDGEIDTQGLARLGAPLPGVTLYRAGDREIAVLAGGLPLNLATGGSPINTFDLTLALACEAVELLLGSGQSYAPGLHALPEAVSSACAALAVARSRGSVFWSK